MNQYYLNVSFVEQEKTFVLSGDQCTKFKVSELILRSGTHVPKGKFQIYIVLDVTALDIRRSPYK